MMAQASCERGEGSVSGTGKMTVAVTRARVLRWLRLESSGDGGSNQSAAVEAGLKQGSTGWSGHSCGRTGTQGKAGKGRM